MSSDREKLFQLPVSFTKMWTPDSTEISGVVGVDEELSPSTISTQKHEAGV